MAARRARPARARSRRACRCAAGPRRPARSSRRAGAHRAAPARVRRGRARRRAGNGRGPDPGWDRPARRPAPRRSRASPWSAGRGPGRRATPPRRRRRSRSRGPPRGRPGRSSRPGARAPRRACGRRTVVCRGRRHRPYRCSPLELRPRRVPAAGGTFLRGAEPRVLPAPRGSASPSSRSSRSTSATPTCSQRRSGAVEGVWPAPPAATTRSAGFVTCSSSRSTDCWVWRPVRSPRSWRGSRPRSRSIRATGRSRIAASRSSRPTSRRRTVGRRSRRPATLLLAERLNPLHRVALERAHELCRALGWPSYAAAYAELRGIDLEALARQTTAFLEATEEAYAAIVDPQLQRAGMAPLGDLRRADLPRFFRAADLDPVFPADRLVDSFGDTLAGLGIDLRTPDQRPPRRRVAPDQVTARLLLDAARSRRGLSGDRADGRAGRLRGALPRGWPRRALREHRPRPGVRVPASGGQLGDRVVRLPARAPDRRPATGFAIGWAWRIPSRGGSHARRQAGASCAATPPSSPTSWSCTATRRRLTRCPLATRSCSTEALRVPWPQASWLADVDGGFYAACYLRAWALETRWRAALRERFGPRWFASPEAGRWLRSLWSHGQRLERRRAARRDARWRARLRRDGHRARLAGRLSRATSVCDRSPRARSCAPCRVARACAAGAARPGSGRRAAP